MSLESNPNKIDTFSLPKTFALKDLLLKYLTYLPLFILSLALSLGAGYIYLRYTSKVYKLNASMLVGGTDAVNRGNNDLINTAMNGTRSVNMQNEIEAMRSKILLEKLVKKHSFNIYYYNLGRIKNSDISEYASYTLIPLHIPDSSKTYTINLLQQTPLKILITINQSAQMWVNWNEKVKYEGFEFQLKNNYTSASSKEPFQVVWRPVDYAIGDIQGHLSIGGLSDKTSILTLTMLTENPSRALAILNNLMQEVVNRDIELKKETSLQTIKFIDDRLDSITIELSRFENQMAAIRSNPRYPELADLYGFYNSEITKRQVQLEGLRKGLSSLFALESFLRNGDNNKTIVPYNLLLEESSLTVPLRDYNQLILKYNNEQMANQPKSFILQNLSTQIVSLRENILDGLSHLRNDNIKTLAATQNQIDSALAPLSSLPLKQREFDEIKRQKSIKEQLYGYLLQKREETSITSFSAKSNYTVLNEATIPGYAFEPQTNRILSFCMLLGLIIPVSIIFLIEILNDKITTKDDIVRKVSVPIVGEISHSEIKKLLIIQSSRNAISEQFRILRANLQFLFKSQTGNQTILVTSSMGGEGKSFISRNLAAVLSLTDKKVVLLQFDLRKLQPSIAVKTEDAIEINKGLVNYLIGQINDPAQLLKQVEGYPQLQVIEPGPIPPNPSELLMSDKMEELFTYLKANFDFIIMDSAPVGLVGDAFLLAKYATVELFIVRQRATHKRQLDFIQEIFQEQKLPHLSLVVNDVQLGGRYGYYGYSYYTYAYRYGYNYGYGYFGKNKKKDNGYFDSYFDDPDKRGWNWPGRNKLKDEEI